MRRLLSRRKLRRQHRGEGWIGGRKCQQDAATLARARDILMLTDRVLMFRIIPRIGATRLMRLGVAVRRRPRSVLVHNMQRFEP